MKRNVKCNKNTGGFESISYKDKTVVIEVFRDGSGFLEVPSIDFYNSEGTHKSRIRELERLASKVNQALKTLEQLEDPKIYFPKKVKV